MNQPVLEAELQRILARNKIVLAVMKKVEEMPVPEGKSKLDLLKEEVEKAGLSMEEIFK